MLISFEFSNYASFRDEALLSLETGNDRTHPDCLISYRNEQYLPVAAVYGPNGSGKTNIHRALDFALQLVTTSTERPFRSPIPVRPFGLDNKSCLEPSVFEFDFVHNGRRFLYRFSCTQERILEESLYEYRTARKSRIFERTEDDQYTFGKGFRSELAPLTRMTAPDRLFLSNSAYLNASSTQDAYRWFLEGIDVLDRDKLKPERMERIWQEQSEDSKDFTLKLLENADLPIFDYELEFQNPDLSEWLFLDRIPSRLDGRTGLMLSPGENQLIVHHRFEDEEGVQAISLPIELEGTGTKNLLALGPYVHEALQNGKTLVVDELDAGLHPELVRYLVKIFQDPEINPNGAQLIFNTQDATLLRPTLFRRDQIYIVEKPEKTGISTIYSLDDFSERKDENIQKAYLAGRYGAVPIVREELLVSPASKDPEEMKT